MTEITNAHKRAIALNLREFGYDVTDEFVAEQVDAIVAGEKRMNIIAMLAESQLKQAGLL